MTPLPTGTLTLLFSDIEGSTSLLQGLGTRWGEALSTHRRILRKSFTAHGGREMGTEGDSFFIVFTSAQEAIAAAIEAQQAMLRQQWPDHAVVKVRIGLHTGEPEVHEADYIGLDVHRAARIAATAHGGQIVLSASTQALAGTRTGFQTRDLGWHRLKDLSEPEHLFDVVAPGMAPDHPPLRSLGTTANLPTYTTEMIGRSREVAEICEAMGGDGTALMTLTGAGGTGKTRLAVAVARALEPQLRCDVYFAALDTADRSALMWAGIAEAVGAPGDADELPEDRVLRFLEGRPGFLVLDNLEQISDADVVVARLLDRAPALRILATSRRPLHLVDEYLYPVSPLALPDDAAMDGLEQGSAAAVDLFVRRARMVRPAFALTPDNVDDVVAICRRLDGIPLAIELAAARSRLLGPKALLERLDDATPDVASQRRVARQRTLPATIRWSYDLLDEGDQRVFRQLGVFSSQFDLDAVSRVVDAGGRDPLDIVAHLVDVNLLEVVEGGDGEPRLFLLETIRGFAHQLLRESDEHDRVRLAHARWAKEVAVQIGSLLHGPRQMSALDRMKGVEEDIRSALHWCLAPTTEPTSERARCGFGLLEPMDAYWYRFGYAAEGRRWHEGALRLLVGDDVPDGVEVLDALHGEGVLALQAKDLANGTDALERALAMARRLDDARREARECNSLGVARREAGDIAAARDLIEDSLAIARRIGDRRREATALSNVVHLHMDAGDYAAAVDAARRAVAVDEELHDPWGVGIDQCNLVMALLSSEGPERAHDQLCQVADGVASLGDIDLTIELIDNCAAVWAGLGDAERAATLLGAADRQREVAGIPRAAPDQAHLDRFIQPVRQSVPDQVWRRAWERGTSFTVQQAVAEGVAHRSEPPTVPPPRTRPAAGVLDDDRLGERA